MGELTTTYDKDSEVIGTLSLFSHRCLLSSDQINRQDYKLLIYLCIYSHNQLI